MDISNSVFIHLFRFRISSTSFSWSVCDVFDVPFHLRVRENRFKKSTVSSATSANKTKIDQASPSFRLKILSLIMILNKAG